MPELSGDPSFYNLGRDDNPNPMIWDCDVNGCFNQVCRPKIEVFSGCFPGKINFGDVDGIVEINWRALMLEWKKFNTDLKLGQKIMYERLTATGIITAICVIGDPKTMEVSKYGTIFKGKKSPFKDATLDDVKKCIRRWVTWAKAQPQPTAHLP